MKTTLCFVANLVCVTAMMATPKTRYINPFQTPVINHRANIEELLQDGVLKITIAIGFTDEKQLSVNTVENIHELNVQNMRQWFQKKNWQQTSIWGCSLAKEVYQGGQIVRYINEKGVQQQLIWVECEFLLPKPESLSFFTQALNDAEILVYMGHGRFGLGPDFDAIDSDKGNFLIGAYSNLHKIGKARLPDITISPKVVVEEKNALEISLKEQVWKSDHYRLWFFNTCNSQLYRDELRSALLPAHIRSSKKTDLLLSEGLVALYAGAITTITFLDNIFKGANLESLPEKLFQVQQEALRDSKQYYDNIIESYNSAYIWQGIADNPVYHAQPPVKKKLK